LSSPTDTDEIPTGRLNPGDDWGQFNNQTFLIAQLIRRIQTTTLVKIIDCTNNGGLSEVGFVDVLPLVNQLDGAGNPTEHETIFNIPYCRIQGGANAVIIDPEPGDIGICVFASRDISKIKNTKAQANPGSYRQHSFSDGLYIGGVLNGVPGQYVQFSSAGIKIYSPTKIELAAPAVAINATVSCTITTPLFTVNGATILNGTVTQTGGGASSFSGPLSGQGTDVHTHVHSGVEAGPSNTGAPTV